MYRPSAFDMVDAPIVNAFMQENNFAALITHRDSETRISHLPFLFDAARGPHGTLLAHVARPNPHWQAFGGPAESVVIFTGPHAYISPAWYKKPEVVPTWNYAVVHAYGIPAVVTDPARCEEIVMRLVTKHETPQGRPWDADLTRTTLQKQLAAIVVFEMPILRLEAKFKLSQNRGLDDQEAAATALESSADPQDHLLARQMRAAIARARRQA